MKIIVEIGDDDTRAFALRHGWREEIVEWRDKERRNVVIKNPVSIEQHVARTVESYIRRGVEQFFTDSDIADVQSRIEQKRRLVDVGVVIDGTQGETA
jgi:hypothetical protein